VEDLQRVSPEVSQWWPYHDARRSVDGRKVMDHPALGRLEFDQINLPVLNDPDVRIVIYAPNAATRQILDQLLSSSCTSGLASRTVRSAVET
jgi:hypothetical protein